MKFGVIGFGNMGGAIVRGALKRGTLKKEDINVFDILDVRNSEAEELGLHVCADDEALCAESDIILLAVKPQQMEEALGMCKKALKGKAMMSIVAGVTIERLKKAIDGSKPRILRLLPNTPALVFEGAFGLCKETDFTDDEKDFAGRRDSVAVCRHRVWRRSARRIGAAERGTPCVSGARDHGAHPLGAEHIYRTGMGIRKRSYNCGDAEPP